MSFIKHRLTKTFFLLLILFKLVVIYRFEKFQGPYETKKVSSENVNYIKVLQQNVTILQDLQVPNNTKKLVVILSAPSHFSQRQRTREFLQAFRNRDVAWAFLLGTPSSNEIQSKLETENQKHVDLLQFSIEDKYENLSLKSLSAFLWSWNKNKSIEWVIKMDDDLEVQLDAILTKLDSFKENKDVIYCPGVLKNMPSDHPIEICPWKRLPDFCNGFLYALHPELAMELAIISNETPRLPMDDLFVTGVLRSRIANTSIGLINRFDHFHGFIETVIECPFLGILHHYLIQNLAVTRGEWPIGTIKKIAENVFKRYLDIHDMIVQGNVRVKKTRHDEI